MNTLLIESNRVIAQKQLNNSQAESETKTSLINNSSQNKATWTTSIENGILLKPGDKISLESAMMNIDAAAGSAQQFVGKVDIPDGTTNIYRTDNEVTLEIGYYITNLIQNNLPLPMGKSMTEINPGMQGNFGSPCFSGRHVWRAVIPTFTGDGFPANHPPGIGGLTRIPAVQSSPDTHPHTWYAERNILVNGPLTIQRNANGTFFSGMNYDQTIPNINAAGTTAPNPGFAHAAANTAGLMSWCNNVGWIGLPGCQFGCNHSTLLPQSDAPKVQNSAFARTGQNLNLNVDVRDSYPNAGDFVGLLSPPNGGADPRVILNQRLGIYPIFKAGGNIDTTGNLPDTWEEYETGPGHYSYLTHMDSTFYKGSQYNYLPNSTKLFQPRIDSFDEMCRGPYYSAEFNNLVSAYDNPNGTTGVNPHFQAAAYMDGMVDFSEPRSGPNLVVQNRDNGYWKLQTSKITIKLQTGNITPNRISELITELMKKNQGNASKPENEFFPQKSFSPKAEEDKSNDADALNEHDVPSLSSQCYATFPTMTGFCLEAQKNKKITGVTPSTPFGWDCLSQDNINYGWWINAGSPIQPGQDYNHLQAEQKFWALILAGDYASWKWATYLNPLIAYRPYIHSETLLPTFNYKWWSVYTGEHEINNGFGIFKLRQRAHLATGVAGFSTVKIGEYGESSCLQLTPPSQFNGVDTLPNCGIWRNIQGTETYLGQGLAVTPRYNRINNEPYALWSDGNLVTGNSACQYRTLKMNDGDIFVTNIIFNAQVKLSDWETAYGELEEHGDPGQNVDDSLESQSSAYFDNTYVKWTIGRLDDQECYPDLYIDRGYAFRIKHRGKKGYVQYLPNVYLTNKLFNWNPNDGGEANEWADITDVLTRQTDITFTAPVTSGVIPPGGTYSLYSRKLGIYDEEGADTYTATHNPFTYPNPAGSIYNTHLGQNFGLPCWANFESEYELDIENKSGFQKISKRTINAYRYLPSHSHSSGSFDIEYNALNAWNELIRQPPDTELWSTSPSSMPYPEFEAIWDTILKFNNGKGIGLIPIFSKDLTLSEAHRNTPFLGVIYKSHEDVNMPVPHRGEWFGLSSPSLSQHNLSTPASTQKTKQQELYKTTNDDAPQYPGTGIRQYANLSNEYQSCFIGQTSSGTTNSSPAGQEDLPTTDMILAQYRASFPSQWATSYYAGASNPSWDFDNNLNRYSYSAFHTPLFTGNGKYNYGNTGETASPQEPELRINSNTANFSRVKKPALSILSGLYAGKGHPVDPPPPSSYNIPQHPNTYEVLEGNIIADWSAAGGVRLAGNKNPQYLAQCIENSGCTQFEVRYLPIGGPQYVTGTWSIPPQPGSCESKLITDSTIVPFAYIEADPTYKYSTISSQCGIGIFNIYIPRIGGDPIRLKSTDYQYYKGTLFDKMGFDLGNFLPNAYQIQTELNHILYSKYMDKSASAYLQYENCVYPVCTQAIVSTSSAPALTILKGNAEGAGHPNQLPDQNFPAYRLGQFIEPATTNADSEAMYAARLPLKLNFPYLTCRSNISTPCGLQYIGGADGKQVSPTIAFLTTNYATDNYFFSIRSDLIFTVTRPYVLTEINTSIHFPDGRTADTILGESSAVIYRIDFAQENLNLTSDEILKKEEDNNKMLGAISEE